MMGKQQIPATADLVPVSRPTLPPLEQLLAMLEQSWTNGVVTNDGPLHRELENSIGNFVGTACALTSSGTSALELALLALGVQPDGEVIVPAFTFPATVQAIRRVGLRPVFTDVDPLTLTMCPQDARSKVSDSTVCVMPVHLFGNLADTEGLREIGESLGLPIIYDAAAAFGSEGKFGPVGSEGRAAVFSFHATKVFTTIEGGAVVSNDEGLVSRVRQLRNFGLRTGCSPDERGTNAKMSELHAAVGLITLQSLRRDIQQRTQLADRYRKNLCGMAGVRVVAPSDVRGANASNLVIHVSQNESGFGATQVAEALQLAGYATRRYFDESYLPSRREYANLPTTASLVSNTLCLPLFPSLDLRDVDRICSIIGSRRTVAR